MKKLIYIDDDVDALDLYQDILSTHFHVTTCSDPEEGLALARKENFDAVLLDIYFPATTGFDLLLKLRSMAHYRTIPLFFISSENTLHNRLKALKMGSEDFINRFMDPNEVVARIKMRVEKNQQEQATGQSVQDPAIYSVGDLELDQDNLVVRCKDKVIPLTQIEYKIIYILLKQFISDPSQVLPKEELIQFVWPMDPESVFPRTLSTHLTNLRKKLDSDQVKIASIRQNGFRLKLR